LIFPSASVAPSLQDSPTDRGGGGGSNTAEPFLSEANASASVFPEVRRGQGHQRQEQLELERQRREELEQQRQRQEQLDLERRRREELEQQRQRQEQLELERQRREELEQKRQPDEQQTQERLRQEQMEQKRPQSVSSTVKILRKLGLHGRSRKLDRDENELNRPGHEEEVPNTTSSTVRSESKDDAMEPPDASAELRATSSVTGHGHSVPTGSMENLTQAIASMDDDVSSVTSEARIAAADGAAVVSGAETGTATAALGLNDVYKVMKEFAVETIQTGVVVHGTIATANQWIIHRVTPRRAGSFFIQLNVTAGDVDAYISTVKPCSNRAFQFNDTSAGSGSEVLVVPKSSPFYGGLGYTYFVGLLGWEAHNVYSLLVDFEASENGRVLGRVATSRSADQVERVTSTSQRMWAGNKDSLFQSGTELNDVAASKDAIRSSMASFARRRKQGHAGQRGRQARARLLESEQGNIDPDGQRGTGPADTEGEQDDSVGDHDRGRHSANTTSTAPRTLTKQPIGALAPDALFPASAALIQNGGTCIDHRMYFARSSGL
jgi:hypothetical protein